MGDIMIKKFTVKNFKNFEDEITINFANHREYSFKQEYIKHDLINKALIYGKNGSGKTNLGLAMMDITCHLVDKQKNDNYYLFYTNGNSIEKDTEFEYEFKFDDSLLLYKYIKNEDRKLKYEEIRFNNDVVFKYNYENNSFVNKIIGFENLDLSKRNQDISVIKYMYNNSLSLDLNSPIKLLVDFANHMLWFRSLRNNEYMGVLTGSDNLDDFIIQNNLVQDFQSFITNLGLDLKLCVDKDALGKPTLCVKYKKGNAPFSHIASTGTKSLWLFYYWMKKYEEISFLYLDEFDAFYHYELSRYILDYVNGNHRFQSILTTQNIFLIDNFIMRPDCYFFLEDGKINNFANKTTKQIRQSHSLQRMFLGGEFNK